MKEVKKSGTAKRPEPSQKSATAGREEAVLEFWKKNDIFKKSLQKDAPNGEYVFYDGPPFATGLPHYGHIVASVIKDVVPRYWTMRGYHVPRVWGWDCHGLPIENIVEKELGFKHKKEIVKMGVAKFNEMCKARVLTFAGEWEKIIPRIGRWADMEHAYKTMDKPFMESVWWVFKQLYDKGLVYEDYRSMHICPRCETTLSQQEVAEGYKEVRDVSVYVKFKVKNPEKHGLPANTYFLAWTTTPWTLPGNVALAVNARSTYQLVALISRGVKAGTTNAQFSERDIGGYYILEKNRVRSVLDTHVHSLESSLEREYKGSELIGLEYNPLLDYYSEDESLKSRENGWKVYAADFVTTESGTGIVHIAPAFGEDDMNIGKEKNLPFVQHVNMDGTMRPEVKDFAGMEVKPQSEEDRVRLGTDIAILRKLEERGALFSKETIEHPYPHCWRCDTPLLNYATSSWFVSVTKLKENLIKNAESINWSPAHIKKGRFGDWLEGARDWSISRQRFWASVIPIWKCEKCKKVRVFGSATELEEASGKKIDDLHKHIVDEITFPCPRCKGEMKRIPDVLDTWFDSGSMPYGERHYPFAFSTDSKGATLDPLKVAPWLKTFPARFIAEGLDQTRAWFYYLHVLAGAIFNKSAFQNVIVNGIVLAEDGKKMSKKLQNYPDPMEVVDKYGADALRFYLLSSPVMQAENLAFMERGVDEAAKKNIGRLGNVLAFYQMYADPVKAHAHGASGISRGTGSANVLDRWILARLDQLIRESTRGFEKYQLDTATRPIVLFIDDLSVWYLRRSRDRFKGEGDGKRSALATLRHVLHTLSLVIAPSMPFFAERLFQAVKEDGDEESVHLAEWPAYAKASAGTARFFGRLFGMSSDTIITDMAAARSIVTQALEARDKAGIKVRQPLASLTVPSSTKLSEEYLSIIADEVNVKKVEKEGERLTLDTHITDTLSEEGIVRDTVRLVQDARKAAKMKAGEHGSVSITVPQENRAVIEKNLDVIQKTTNTRVEFS